MDRIKEIVSSLNESIELTSSGIAVYGIEKQKEAIEAYVKDQLNELLKIGELTTKDDYDNCKEMKRQANELRREIDNIRKNNVKKVTDDFQAKMKSLTEPFGNLDIVLSALIDPYEEKWNVGNAKRKQTIADKKSALGEMNLTVSFECPTPEVKNMLIEYAAKIGAKRI